MEATKPITKKRQQTKDKIIAAIGESNGLLTVVAKRTGLHYCTVMEYAKYPDVRQAITEAKERMLDFAESKLWEKIRDGDNTMIIFFLKTQGKARGYIERAEFTGANGTPLLNINVNSTHTQDNIENVVSRLSAN